MLFGNGWQGQAMKLVLRTRKLLRSKAASNGYIGSDNLKDSQTLWNIFMWDLNKDKGYDRAGWRKDRQTSVAEGLLGETS